MVMVCRHQAKHSCMKWPYDHPPRKPDNNLSAEHPDQLCLCQVQARTVQPLKVGKNNTSVGMRLQHISFSGADSFTISTKPQFCRLSRVLAFHEALSRSKRKVNNALVSKYVDECVISKDLAKNLQNHTRNEYPKERVSNLKDSMLFQMCNSSEKKVDVEIHLKDEDDNGQDPIPIQAFERSWRHQLITSKWRTDPDMGTPWPPCQRISQPMRQIHP
jgi:hypothetical protein